jgi:hypothetical protein
VKLQGVDTPVTVKGGHIVQDGNGKIDYERSNPYVYYVDAESNSQVTPTDRIEGIIGFTDTQTALMEATAAGRR